MAVQPEGEKNAVWRPHCNLPVPEVGLHLLNLPYISGKSEKEFLSGAVEIGQGVMGSN